MPDTVNTSTTNTFPLDSPWPKNTIVSRKACVSNAHDSHAFRFLPSYVPVRSNSTCSLPHFSFIIYTVSLLAPEAAVPHMAAGILVAAGPLVLASYCQHPDVVTGRLGGYCGGKHKLCVSHDAHFIHTYIHPDSCSWVAREKGGGERERGREIGGMRSETRPKRTHPKSCMKLQMGHATFRL